MNTRRPARFSNTLALVPPAVALLAQPADAAFDAFIKIGDVKGESVDAKHTEWIDLQSVQWGISRPVAPVAGGGGRETGTPQVSELVIAKQLDASSPHLFLNATAGGTTYPTVTLELVHPTTRAVFYRLTLENVLVTSLSQSAADGDDVVGESVSLNFTKIKIEYYKTDAKGGTGGTPITASWDVANAKN